MIVCVFQESQRVAVQNKSVLPQQLGEVVMGLWRKESCPADLCTGMETGKLKTVLLLPMAGLAASEEQVDEARTCDSNWRS